MAVSSWPLLVTGWLRLRRCRQARPLPGQTASWPDSIHAGDGSWLLGLHCLLGAAQEVRDAGAMPVLPGTRGDAKMQCCDKEEACWTHDGPIIVAASDQHA